MPALTLYDKVPTDKEGGAKFPFITFTGPLGVGVVDHPDILDAEGGIVREARREIRVLFTNGHAYHFPAHPKNMEHLVQYLQDTGVQV